MSQSVSAEKAAVRARYRAANRTATVAQRHEASISLCRQILESNLWERGQNLMLFAPLPDEPDILPLLQKAIEQGKRLLLPRFEPQSESYQPAHVKNLAHDAVVGKFGVLEPLAGCSAWPLKQLDLMLVPGVAFDAYGYRLGRGKGYYDQMLSHTAGITLGLAFDWQIDTRLPVEPHDVKLDCILTPTRWVKTLADARF